MTNIGLGKLKEKQLNYLWWHLLNDLLLIVIYFMVWRHCLQETVLHWPCMRQKLGEQQIEGPWSESHNSWRAEWRNLRPWRCVLWQEYATERKSFTIVVNTDYQSEVDLSPGLGLPPSIQSHSPLCIAASITDCYWSEENFLSLIGFH